MNVNFVESNPIPVKSAMGLMGLLEPGLPPADGPSERGKPRKNRKRVKQSDGSPGRIARRRRAIKRRLKPPCNPPSNPSTTPSPRPTAAEDFRLFADFKTALNRGEIRAAEPDASVRYWLARQRLGQARHPAWLPHGQHRRYVGRAARSSTNRPIRVKRFHRGKRRPHRARRLERPRRRAISARASPACRRCSST